MAMAGGKPAFAWLVEYEVGTAVRYCRFVSVVLLCAGKDPDLGRGPMWEWLSPLMRGSDVLFDLQDEAAIMMSETNTSGALVAIERFQATDPNMRVALASFPGDGQVHTTLMTTAFRRLAEAKQGHAGVVVAVG